MLPRDVTFECRQAPRCHASWTARCPKGTHVNDEAQRESDLAVPLVDPGSGMQGWVCR